MNPSITSIICTVNSWKKGPFTLVTKHLESFCGHNYLQAIMLAKDGGKNLMGSITDF